MRKRSRAARDFFNFGRLLRLQKQKREKKYTGENKYQPKEKI